ncbi:diguanylate cyclase [Halarcobacter anaerophilus]|jgi:diguanylate cyclase (GGDEF)-like protein|uniref:diguanylate cyclase n=1 Tax=Halarcobacter anaerophilus TaxID=877500 RepID=A0A4Q0XYZ5_9BACT|nr:diguanylate cyclase [Halarcobacter anaerophilus]QDF29958.1 response regulator receiver-modulated diguanylate cyclase [Halarcobacter anaerophilus]RXJ62920.1 REC domain-containing diguanylate cyclase [Halarcobacter anaerophilus]
MSKRVLIIEDSKSVSSTLEAMIKDELGFKTVIGSSVKQCAKLLLEYKGKFDIALLDLGLPDSYNGEIVDFVTKFNIPIVILTATSLVENEIKYRNKNIVDYVIKDGLYSFKYAISVIRRIVNNDGIKLLIVDDSKSFLDNTKDLIERYKIEVFTATNGLEALEILEKNKDIKIILTDYYMPFMNGLELVRTVRKKYAKDELSIIVTSVTKERQTASKFLKYGANDFLYKGFTQEELFVRINANIELLELFEELKNRANKDFLTKLYNRRYLFEEGNKILKEANEKKNRLFAALIDIDKFKNINDTYGHDIGDLTLKEVSKILRKYFKKDELIARLGGEEFCILFKNKDEDLVKQRLELLRKEFAENVIELGDLKLKFTISIGCSFKKADALDIMLQEADKGLYEAKETGRNRIRYR